MDWWEEMTREGKLVVYTDPAWAVSEGKVDPSRASIEREVLGPIELQLGRYHKGAFASSEQELIELVSGADAVVIYRVQLTRAIVAALAPRCKVVARQGVGTDNMAIPLLKEFGIFGFNVPDYCVDEVTNHTLALVLAHERGIVRQSAHIKSGSWDIFFGGRPRRMCDLTLGIVGFGRIGCATARKCHMLFRRVVAYDPFVSHDLMRGYGVDKRPDLHTLLAESDVVVLHASLNDGSRGMIDEHAVRCMKRGSVLVNTARGPLVKPEAVLMGLEQQILGGYLSDVFHPEDPNQHAINKRLLQHDSVLVTAHRAFLSNEAEISQRRRVAEGVAQVLASVEPPVFGRVA